MSSMLIEARGLGKSYPKVHRPSDRVRALGRLLFGNPSRDTTTVLHDISLSVPRGESVGIIGENGAGKSTLLKLISGVLTPTTGSVRVHGNVGALLELGAGFHPEFTGRDNITMTAALAGLSGEALREKLPGIIEFADIGSYIDEPIKHYSSGMVVRLGFAVIASLRPDLLITDEVLAVGDESFQKKCVQWLERYLEDGGTLLLVSHSMYHIQKLCRHACWLRDGTVAMQGDVYEVTQAYLAHHERKLAALKGETDQRHLPGEVEFTVSALELNGQSGEGPVVVDSGSNLRVTTRLASRDGRVPVAHFGFARADGTPVYGFNNVDDGVQIASREGDDEYVCEIEFSSLKLLPGSYIVRAHAMDSEGLRMFDTFARGLVVRGATREMGLVHLPHRWLDRATTEGSDD